MEKLKILKILNKSAIVGLAIAAISFIIPLVPCTKSPVIAEPKYAWAMCNLPNPFTASLGEVSTKYYGAFADPLAGAVLQFIIPAAIFAAIFIIFRKKTAKILDLSK